MKQHELLNRQSFLPIEAGGACEVSPCCKKKKCCKKYKKKSVHCKKCPKL